ncbi:MAG: glycoside hydrolase family 25 protein [Clostridia bacterium]|nr:glycoside hydrolase family 25 protein [Clostridia bacterium]
MIKGIDVSDNNGKINWAAVKAAGVDFAILRIGYGNDDVGQDDKRFEENVAGCEANGIPWGAYIYSYAMSEAEAKSEAAHMLRRLKGKKPSYPVCFDMEDADGYKAKRGGLSKEKAVTICETFLDTVEDSGYYVALYASLSWLTGILNDSRLDRFDKWVAQWNTVCDYQKSYGMWQYGGSTNYIESPYINGISGAVDKDYAYIDYPAVIKAAGLNGYTKSPYGYLDTASETSATGWAYNGTNDTPVEVHLYAYKNDEPIFLVSVLAEDLRDDLVGKIGNGYHGFNADYSIKDEGNYTIKAYAIDKDGAYNLKGEKAVEVNSSAVPTPDETPAPDEAPTPDTPDDETNEKDTEKGILAALKRFLRLVLKWIVE